MKLNYPGIMGAILAFVSVALPWWTVGFSSVTSLMPFSGGASVYLFQATASMMGASLTVSMNFWFGWTSLALVLVGGLLGLVGSILNTRRTVLLAVSGLLVMLSLLVFAAGLQSDISNGALAMGFPTGPGLFSSSYYNVDGASVNYTSYLSFGFWVALFAAILMFVGAAVREPSRTIPPPPTSPPPAPPPQV